MAGWSLREKIGGLTMGRLPAGSHPRQAFNLSLGKKCHETLLRAGSLLALALVITSVVVLGR
jgi:hypothetical protein